MSINHLMETCPLKQYIRESLWEKYIKELKKKNINYLTLYSPPLMDVKHFTKKGLIQLEQSVYKGVMAITNDEIRGLPETIKRARGRPEFLFAGAALHELIKDKKNTELRGTAYDVINLDYCNSIFGSEDSQYISSNLKDIESIIEQQDRNNCKKFMLFITSRTDSFNSRKVNFAPSFINELTARIRLNLEKNDSFRDKYKHHFGTETPSALAGRDFSSFFPIGMAKLVSMEFASKNYAIEDCDVCWLIRNKKTPIRELLHMAFSVQKKGNKIVRVRQNKLEQFGTYTYMEEGVTLILDKIDRMDSVNENEDYDKLSKTLGRNIEELRNDTFEIRIPEPI